MDFWNDNTMFVAQMKNVDSKKSQNIVKKIKKIKHHQMKNLLVKCIENFLIYIYFLVLKSFKWCDCYKFLFLKIYFTLKNLIFCMNFFYQSHV
jgi:hypothetical protein